MATGTRGLHVPLVTPFDEAGAVDLAALERLAGEVLDDGADGLVALATTAEASSLDERERDAVVAVCARVAADRGFLLSLLLRRGAGAIAASAHLCTERFAALIADAHAGRLDDARAHAEALLAMVLALFAEPSPAVLKALLHHAGRIPTPDVRMPLAGASAAALERARRSAPARSSARAPARAR
jgi:dihydrodipicolinate synthase/N-acetylneuraminate lyase